MNKTHYILGTQAKKGHAWNDGFWDSPNDRLYGETPIAWKRAPNNERIEDTKK